MRTSGLILLAFLVGITGCETPDSPTPVTVRAIRHSGLSSPVADLSLNTSVASAKSRVPLTLPGRMVVKTADLRFQVQSYRDAVERITRLIVEQQGFIANSQTDYRENTPVSGSLEARVPSAQFEHALAQIRLLATRIDQENIRGTDVTEEFYDVHARLDNWRHAEKRYLDILRLANKAKDVLEVERAIADLRGEIERIEARKRYLEEHADLATIRVSLYEPRPPAVAADGAWAKMRKAFGRGANGFVDIITNVITLVVAVGPFLLLLGGAVLASVRVYRVVRARFVAVE
jgi:hypothetical protein